MTSRSEELESKLTIASANDPDPTASERKKDHIEMAFNSQVAKQELDQRFYYEPILAAHPEEGSWPAFSFLNKEMKIPVWVSSMTGGTALAHTINHNLAKACHDFGMGMGLGSCRSLLYSNDTLKDFDVRHLIGDDLPLYANLGVAQVEELILNNGLSQLKILVDKLSADGLIIHVNPFQEWLQPEGDRFSMSPIEVIKRVLDAVDFPIIVKEVGQGMGKKSLEALFKLPLAAIDFAANGGTNFAKLELLRSDETKKMIYSQLANVGHSALDMVHMTNEITAEIGSERECEQVIISGGVKNFLDGYHLIESVQLSAIYGQASAFLKHARDDYESLFKYVEAQVRGLELAKAFLRVK
ncbi:MAG: isopentenyl-diphosphate delta-isomerase [Bacteroidota bacterium]